MFVLPAVVRCGPPPLNDAQSGASNLGPANTRPGARAAAAAMAASSAGGIAIVSPAAGGVGQVMLCGPRITVSRSIRRTAGYLACRLAMAASICVSQSLWVVMVQLSTVSTMRSGDDDCCAHADVIGVAQNVLFGLAHSVM